MRLAASFTLDEFAVSSSAPSLVEPVPAELVATVRRLATDVLQPIRDAIGRPMTILSGYRSPALNRAVGGSTTSQHVRGEAADWTCDDVMDAWTLVRRLVVAGELATAGQLIVYPDRGFVHVALRSVRYPRPTTCLHWPARGHRYRPIPARDDDWWAAELGGGWD